MEINFSQLKKKKVVNVLDGRDLGKVCDLVFTFPEGRVLALIVSKKALFSGDELVINLCCINKIGDDAILVSLKEPNMFNDVCTDETCE